LQRLGLASDSPPPLRWKLALEKVRPSHEQLIRLDAEPYNTAYPLIVSVMGVLFVSRPQMSSSPSVGIGPRHQAINTITVAKTNNFTGSKRHVEFSSDPGKNC